MWIHYERLHNHNKAKPNKTVCIFLGIYCIAFWICCLPCNSHWSKWPEIFCGRCTRTSWNSYMITPWHENNSAILVLCEKYPSRSLHKGPVMGSVDVLSPVSTSYQTNSTIAGDLRRDDTHLLSLWWYFHIALWCCAGGFYSRNIWVFFRHWDMHGYPQLIHGKSCFFILWGFTDDCLYNNKTCSKPKTSTKYAYHDR